MNNIITLKKWDVNLIPAIVFPILVINPFSSIASIRYNCFRASCKDSAAAKAIGCKRLYAMNVCLKSEETHRKKKNCLTGRRIKKIKFENINIREVQRFQIKNTSSKRRALYFRNCYIQELILVNRGRV